MLVSRHSLTLDVEQCLKENRYPICVEVEIVSNASYFGLGWRLTDTRKDAKLELKQTQRRGIIYMVSSTAIF